MFQALDILAATGDVEGFVRSNGLKFEAKAPAPILGRTMFELLTTGFVTDKVSGPGWETGTLHLPPHLQVEQTFHNGRQVAVVSVSDDTTFQGPPVGYLALTLARRLPNMVLDGKRNNPLVGSSLLHLPLSDQRFSLEGDFDKYFDLYVPSGYERDALYVFTPDLMALMIDEASDFDIEIRDDQLIVYASAPLDLKNPAWWQWMERVMAVVGRKAFTQTDGYSDERVGDRAANVVAPEARLLRRGLTRENKWVLWTFAAGVAIMLLVGIVSIAGFVGLLLAF